MAISLSSALAAAVLVQGAPAASDSIAQLWARVATDSTDGPAWFRLGRAYIRVSAEYHLHGGPPDTARARAVLDTADQAFARAARWTGAGGGTGKAEADSARVFRVYTWGERVFLAWEQGGVEAAAEARGAVPEDLKLPPVLEELGENLLRACPREGVLLTASDADSYAAWYMRFARRLRPDLLILPLAMWRSDSVFRARVSQELKLGRAAPRGAEGGSEENRWLRALVERRPVCASMALERPPEARPRIRWQLRPLLWVAGPDVKGDRVPPRDFVFAALRLALDQHEAWAEPALALYRRAAAATRTLCEPLATFGLIAEVGCRR